MNEETKYRVTATKTQSKHPKPVHCPNGDLCEARCPSCPATLSAMAACWLDPNGSYGLAKRTAV